MAAAQTIISEMNAMLKEFILQLPPDDCEHCGNNYGNFSKYSDHIVHVQVHSISVEYSKKWDKLKGEVNPFGGFEQLPCSQTGLMI